MGPMGGGDFHSFHSWGITRMVGLEWKNIEKPQSTWMIWGNPDDLGKLHSLHISTISARPADRGLRCWSACRIGLAPTSGDEIMG